jgi:hypothetical protein
MIAAVGRGHHRSNDPAHESLLEKIRAETTDPNPISSKYPTLFHRLSAMAPQLEVCIKSDLEDYQDWYLNMRTETEKNLTKLARS